MKLNQSLLIGGIFFILGCQSQVEKQEEASSANGDTPNFVIIFCDDLGYGDLGVYGNELIKTPNLDQMAAEGMRFTDFYSANPVCSPSRAGLLTGRYPVRMGINKVFFPQSWTGMSPEEVTIAEMLKQKDYATGIVGKWHLGHHHKYLPLQQGFDSYFGIPYSNDMEAVVYMRGNDVVQEDVDQRYTTKTYTEESLAFIEENKDRPFFLYLAHSMPHVPLYASENFEGKSKAGLYGDVIEEIDWSTGEVLKKLDELGIGENTMVLFTSDNGPWLVFGPEGGSAGPLREGKQYTFEGGMRVPGIVRWPGKVPAGVTSSDLVSTLDMLPTIAALTQSDLPSDRVIDGMDITDHLFDQKSLGDRELAFYMDGQYRAYRSGDWKVKMPFKGSKRRWYSEGVPAHDTLLFNLAEDIGEENNLVKTNPAKLKEMVAMMQDFEASLGDLPPTLRIRQKADNSHKEKQKKWLEESNSKE
ncbi:MAG: sulfatase [Ekhidna sp.]|nr:sulfatase [Ekhidna sp.]